jgi:plasmid stability protein
MATLTIRNLPDSVYRRLNELALLNGRSLNAQVIHILRSGLDNYTRLEKVRASAEELEQLVDSMPPMEDREDRNRDIIMAPRL